jgi:hypothetical protein
MVDRLWIQKLQNALGERNERLRAESIQFKSFEDMRKDSRNRKKVYAQNKVTRLKKDNLALLQQKLIKDQLIKELKIEHQKLKRKLKEGYQPTQPLDLV